MKAVALTFIWIPYALIAGGVGLMIWPTKLAEITARKRGQRPTTDEVLQKRILGFAIAAIGAFILFMIARHSQCDYCLA